ncbi:MAG: N-acetylmuramoyl-L-alanine amidase [Chloroflexaceae bacterium]|nr:N-acetylmuramoyl-L-alanine amidase [Chloroflexaceae bacterium]
MIPHTPSRIVLTHEGGVECCDEDPRNRIRGNQNVHQNTVGWPDIAFHYIVTPDGDIYEGRNDGYQSSSSYARINPGYDLDGTIVIGLLGNYDRQIPRRVMIQATEDLMAWLCQEYGISSNQIYYLRDVAPDDVSGGATTSPGSNMPESQQFRNAVADILDHR